jgi:hypothetical protein
MGIVAGLTTLANVKAGLNIPVANTAYDSLLTTLINQVSAAIVRALGYPVKRQTITGEKAAVNGTLLLQLRAQPIQSVSSVTLAGAALLPDSDSGFYLLPEYSAVGMLYRPMGWYGPFLTRGITYDPLAGTYCATVDYVAGWYLPADVGYQEGADASLPLDLSAAADYEVAFRFNTIQRGSQGLSSMTEGKLSYDFAGGRPQGQETAPTASLSAQTEAMIAPFMRIPV